MVISQKKMLWVATAFAGLSIMTAGAQQNGPPTDTTGHTRHNGVSIPAVTIPEAGEGDQTMQGMKHDAIPAMPESDPAMDHEMQSNSPATVTQDMSGMDHGDINVQADSPVSADSRDPHANSDGYILGSGKYALPGPRQLHLADEHNFGALLVNRLEYMEGKTTTYDAQAWYGRTYDRLVLKAEGDINGGELDEANTELLWGHSIAPYWDTQLGVRYDTGVGPDQGWLAFGVQGLAPYWFEVDATAYLGDSGRTAFNLEAEYELLLTQKLVLQPRAELNLYGKRDEERGIGSGLSGIQAGLRLRYEYTRQFAPYAGIEWTGKFGETADLARMANESTRYLRWVAGVRFWY